MAHPSRSYNAPSRQHGQGRAIEHERSQSHLESSSTTESISAEQTPHTGRPPHDSPYLGIGHPPNPGYVASQRSEPYERSFPQKWGSPSHGDKSRSSEHGSRHVLHKQPDLNARNHSQGDRWRGSHVDHGPYQSPRGDSDRRAKSTEQYPQGHHDYLETPRRPPAETHSDPQRRPPPPGPPPRPPPGLTAKISPLTQTKVSLPAENLPDGGASSLKLAPGPSAEEKGRPVQIKIHSAFGEDTDDENEEASSSTPKRSVASASARDKPSSTIEPDLGVGKDHRKMAALVSNKKFTSHISRWNTKSEEVQAIVEEKERRKAAKTSSANAEPLGSGTQSNTIRDEPAEERRADDDDDDDTEVPVDFDFLDTERRLACLLCQRQFKSKDILLRHAKESDLHKRNLEDAATRKQGKSRKVGKTEAATTMRRAGFAPVAEEYRDRASERRAIFGSEEVAAPTKAAAGEKEAEKQRAPQAEPVSAPLDESNKGGAMLAKMGWSTGMGLGKESSGQVNPVEAKVYRQGAGLGSSEGKNAEEEGRKRPREGKDAYVDEARERSRQRLLEEK